MDRGCNRLTGPSQVWLPNLRPQLGDQSLATWLWLLALLLLPIDIAVRRLVVSRSDMQAIWRAVRLQRPVATSAEPSVAALATLRARRSGSAQQPVAGVQRTDEPSGEIFLRPPLRPASKAASEKAPAGPAADAAPEEGATTASHLLAARKRRR